MQPENPLVSIVVITYNSSKYVLETLESCKAQTYENIELIVSDDGSTDDTVSICKEWIKLNNKIFRRTQVLEVSVNTGTTDNCKRGLMASSGEWIKLIAGDDILFDNAMESVINFALGLNSDNCGAILTSEVRFSQLDDATTHVPSPSKKGLKHPFYYANAKLQFQYLMLGKFISGASIYYKARPLKDNSVFNNRISLLVEDYLAATHLTSLGLKICYLNLATVYYRKENQGITAKSNSIYPKYYKDVLSIRNYFVQHKDLPLLIRLAVKWENFIYTVTIWLGNRNSGTAIINSSLRKISPGRIQTFLMRRVA